MTVKRSLAALLVVPVLLTLVVGGASHAQAPAKPDGEMRWALYVTLSPNCTTPPRSSAC